MARFNYYPAFVSIARFKQSRVLGQAKECAELEKNKEAVQNDMMASEMARE